MFNFHLFAVANEQIRSHVVTKTYTMWKPLTLQYMVPLATVGYSYYQNEFMEFYSEIIVIENIVVCYILTCTL